MFTTICFNDDYKDAIKKVYITGKEDRIILKCKYYTYPDIIFNNTRLPKVLVDLICKWIDDEIIFKITGCSKDDSVYIQSDSACINCVDININFRVSAKALLFDQRFDKLYNIHLCKNIIMLNNGYVHDPYTQTRSILHKIIETCKKCKTIEKICTYESMFSPKLLTATIVNENLLLFAINILYMFNKIRL